MRVASLLSACTEWVAAIGAADLLIGRSHECNYPENIRHLPELTQPTVRDESSKSIDETVRARLNRGLSLFDVDLDALARLKPDLILTQAQCDVCAVSVRQLELELAGVLEPAPEIFSFDPCSFKEVLDLGLRLGRRLERTASAMAVIGEGEKRLQRLHDRVGNSKRTPNHARPSVGCIEWIEPLMTSANWVPDLVSLAGGRSVCARPGERSAVVAWSEIVAEDPDVIALVPCGFDIDRTIKEMDVLTEREEWSDLSAVRHGRVFVFDGQAYFNRPGPRLYRSVELLAAAIHGRHAGVTAHDWEMQHVELARETR